MSTSANSRDITPPRAVGVHKCQEEYRSPAYDRSTVRAIIKEVRVMVGELQLVYRRRKLNRNRELTRSPGSQSVCFALKADEGLQRLLRCGRLSHHIYSMPLTGKTLNVLLLPAFLLLRITCQARTCRRSLGSNRV